MLQKLIVVYNPRSSRYDAVEREVLAPARRLKGWLVGKYEVQAAPLHENAVALSKLLHDGDLVVVAGGDGTASVAINGVMQSEKDVTLSVLGYGNFNDVARLLKTKRPVEYGGEYVGGISEILQRFEQGRIKKVYPLEAKVNGRHWRYALAYLTVGLLAESTEVFDQGKVRHKLQKRHRGLVFSIWQLAKWYFRHHKAQFLGAGELRQGIKSANDEKLPAAKPVQMKRKSKAESQKRPEKSTKKVSKKSEPVAKQQVKKLWQKTRAKSEELWGRFKATTEDLKVQTEVKVVKTRQKHQEKQESAAAMRPEIIIDTELTRQGSKKKKMEQKNESKQ